VAIPSEDRILPKNQMTMNSSLIYDINMDEDTHQVARSNASRAIGETIKSRVLLQRGEWFLKLTQGIPWLTDILGRNNDINMIRSFVTAEIIQTWGVDEVLSLDLIVDKNSRKLDIMFKYRDIYGNIIREVI
jgi:hypothetical protein